jgi:DNA-binding NtrC family response regulator
VKQSRQTRVQERSETTVRQGRSSVRQPHVLLIEDDVAVRAATHLLLRVAGYQVSVAACIAEATDHARHHQDFEVVISDYHLSDHENGVAAIAAVRAICGPGLRAILMSGDTGLLLTDAQRGPSTFLSEKPTRVDEFLALLPSRQS